MDPNALKQRLVAEGALWVLEERERARADGRPLTSTERSILASYLAGFPSLDDVRIQFVPHLSNPSFFGQLPSQVRGGLDFSAMDAIAFVDAIAARQSLESDARAWISTLLHELTHVAQYAILGVEGFVREYVDGFVENGFAYRKIPLEVMAYGLQDRFEHGASFSIWNEARRELDRPE